VQRRFRVRVWRHCARAVTRGGAVGRRDRPRMQSRRVLPRTGVGCGAGLRAWQLQP
jgi:hypothetical protein